jgi:hypothetical protein
MIRELPPFLRDMLATPPSAGEGVHRWLFTVARQLHAHLPAGEIVTLLKNRVAGCGRHVPRHEIVAAVQNALLCAWQPKGKATPIQSAAKWPSVNQERREAIVRDGGGLADLWGASPIRIADNRNRAEEIADNLFPGNPLLCCGKSNQEFNTKARNDWRGQLSALALIVPSPMLAVTGQTKDGRESKHTLSNTGEWRFLVCEFDTGARDEQAALLLHLGTFAPLVCVVDSGGKSLHGWFYVHGQPEVKIERFFRYAVSLGADHATWTRSQFVRMPDGWRLDGKDPNTGKRKPQRQTVFFLNFRPLEGSQ